MKPFSATQPTPNRLLKRTGRYYIAVVLALTQIIITPLGISLAALILFYNAGLTTRQFTSLALFTVVVLIIRNVLLLAGTHLVNREAVARLKKWEQGRLSETDEREESRAWRQITTLSWRYVAVAVASLFMVVLIPALIYMRIGLSATSDQMIYTVFAGFASGLALAVLEVLLIERMLTDARELLVPTNFEMQITGVPGFRLLGKFIFVMFALILISVLLIAPIGYHQTTRVLYEEIGSIKVLADLQTQSIVSAIFALLVGLGLSFFLARAISLPVGEMISVFKKMEAGDLSQRVTIAATDEVGELAVYFNRMAGRLEELQTGLEKRVAERTEQLRVTIEVGQVASSILEPAELVQKVVGLITERFGHYYAAIFLADQSGQWAELKDATGTAGQTLKAQGHRLEIGGRSMVGSAIARREARVALDIGAEPVRFDNPLLPQTRSEIALPLLVGNRVVGALDVQSMREAAFDEDDINTLQGMANQVAIALENARLFQETQRNLEELRAAHQLYVAGTWSGMPRDSYTYESGTGGESAGGETINVPLTLREQPIGQISLEGDAAWSPEERNLVEAIAAQAALALENARLLEESQQMALRERLASEIIGKVWSSSNMELILQTAVKELGRALRADEAIIELDPDQ